MSEFIFEEGFDRLKEIVKLLQQEQLSVDKAMALYKEGCELAKKLKEYIQKAKQEIEIYSEGLFENRDIDGFTDD